MDKKFYIAIAVLVVLIVLVFWGDYVFSLLGIRERVEAKEFAGRIIKTENNLVFMSGRFISENNQPNPQKEEKEVRVFITPETKIIKTIIYLPGLKDVGPDGSYDPATLRRETVDGSKDDLVPDRSSVLIKSDKNIFNKRKFSAVSIEYIEPIYP